MNKYQNALDRLANIDLQTYPSIFSIDDFSPEDFPDPAYARDCYREEFDILQELVNKTIPVKAEMRLEVRPEYGENGAYVDADVVVNYHCPKCGTWISCDYAVSDKEELTTICSGCGQEIQGVEDE